MVSLPQRTAVLAQFNGVETVSVCCKSLGHVLLKEIVDISVHIEHRPPRIVGRAGSLDKCGNHLAVVIGSKGEGVILKFHTGLWGVP